LKQNDDDDDNDDNNNNNKQWGRLFLRSASSIYLMNILKA